MFVSCILTSWILKVSDEKIITSMTTERILSSSLILISHQNKPEVHLITKFHLNTLLEFTGICTEDVVSSVICTAWMWGHLMFSIQGQHSVNHTISYSYASGNPVSENCYSFSNTRSLKNTRAILRNLREKCKPFPVLFSSSQEPPSMKKKPSCSG